ncbi:hypothetical protein CAPTEDRAFT_214520 [Capitella teleta]|uniref:CARD domain-containing protein n=1 Tax=Capitella teleta TaxID=283909 RepID=R7UXU7_CAPTE|nr:hypothetical protein CAPTEDRAFT_214520 [Capitella teleta]|eukprot:ELU08241.1 hypothetical protein CAPTEDRAFT_214520 [Capitella teleta]
MTILSKPRRELLQKKRVGLVKIISLENGLWDLMESSGLVPKSIRDRFKLNKTPDEQVGELLNYIGKRTEEDYVTFGKCLNADNQRHVTEMLGIKQQGNFSMSKMTILSKPRRELLRKKRVELVNSIRLENGLWDLMESSGLVLKSIRDRFKLNSTPDEQVGKLLDYLGKRTEEDHVTFGKCLNADNQWHVTQMLGIKPQEFL